MVSLRQLNRHSFRDQPGRSGTTGASPRRAWHATALVVVSLALAGGACSAGEFPREVAPGVQQIGRIAEPRLTESSGIVASRQHPGVFWTHNDGGGKRQSLYALTREGQTTATFRIGGAPLIDWEDIAADNAGHLYLADTGNNDGQRSPVAVYRVTEPDLKHQGGTVLIDRTWRLLHPRPIFDCEAMFVHGTNGYLISKVFKDRDADLYRFPLVDQAGPFTLEKLATLRVDSPVTGADLSSDGQRLALVAKNGAYLYSLAEGWDGAFRRKPVRVSFKHDHIEACTFVPEGLLATAESREIYLFTNEVFRAPPVKLPAPLPKP